MKMMEMSNSISTFAQGVQQELAKRNLPSALEAVTQQDKSLPPHTKEKVRKAKQTCSAPALFELRQKCEADEDEAMSLIQVIMAMLDEEGDKDKALLRDVPSAKLSSMKTSMTLQVSSNSCSTRQQHPPAALTTPPLPPLLQTLRSTVTAAKDMITKPGRNCPATRETTKKQGERLDAALEEIEQLTHSMDEIEGMMPHLDGTPSLEQEPCVKALRKLIEDLDQIKVDSAAQMVVLREKAEYQQKDASLGEELVQAVKGGGGSRERSIDAVDEVLKRRMSEFEIIDADLGALHNRSSKLIKEVDVQKKLFEKATAKAKSYGARQEYFKKLLHGAEELVELHAGLKEASLAVAILATARSSTS